jgi:hypothetical protein
LARHLLHAFALLSLAAAPAAAQDLPCAEFRVNTATVDYQDTPAVASDGAGNFVVVWNSYGVANPPGVQGQRFSAAGTPRGGEFQVNTFSSAFQGYASVASVPTGEFIVTWDSLGQDGNMLGVYAQRFGATGDPVGPEFRVNTYTTDAQADSSVAADAAGNFVVVWTSYGQNGLSGIFAQRYDNSGNAAGPEFQVDSYTGGYQYVPRVAKDGAGNFVVVWMSYDQDGDATGIHGQRFDAGGVAQGAEFPINTYTTGRQASPRVAADGAGNFVVVWTSSQDGDSVGIVGRRFDAAGLPQGPEFIVNSVTTGLQASPDVAFDSSGAFVVVWTTEDADGRGVSGRRFSAAGVAQGPEFPINTFTSGLQVQPRLAATTHRGFVATWMSEGQDGSSGGVYASQDCTRLYTLAPCRLVDTRPAGALAANSTRAFPVSGVCNVPADARAVAVNVTAVNPTDLGNLRLFPAGQAVPNASTLNFVAGASRANNAVATLGAGGEVAVRCDMPPGSPGSTHLVLDVFGYFKR